MNATPAKIRFTYSVQRQDRYSVSAPPNSIHGRSPYDFAINLISASTRVRSRNGMSAASWWSGTGKVAVPLGHLQIRASVTGGAQELLGRPGVHVASSVDGVIEIVEQVVAMWDELRRLVTP